MERNSIGGSGGGIYEDDDEVPLLKKTTPDTSTATDAHPNNTDSIADEEKTYWHPPPLIRTAVNALMHQAAWGGGYVAAQLYYTAIISAFMADNFVTIMSNGTLVGTLPKNEIGGILGLSVGFNAACAVGSYLLVRIQLSANKRSDRTGSNWTKALSVFVTKWIDNAVDGSTFFSTNLMYVVIISSFGFSNGMLLFPEMLGCGLILLVVTITITAVGEELPALWHRVFRRQGQGQPNAASKRTAEIINDWFIGQWAWLLGFVWWTLLLSLYTAPYLDIFKHPWAWWVMCIVLAIGYFGYSVCFRVLCKGCCDASPRSSIPLVSSRTKGRIAEMLQKSFAWLLGIGLYFTLKCTFPVFADALAERDVDRRQITAFSGSVTAICFVLLCLIELYTDRKKSKEQRTQRKERTGYNDDDEELVDYENHNNHDHGHDDDDRQKTKGTIGLPIPPEGMLKLSLCYVTGQAWNAETVGLGSRATNRGTFALIGFHWQLAACSFAIAESMWALQTQKFHGSGHSRRCVCTVCAPEFYEGDVIGDWPERQRTLREENVTVN